MRLKLLLLWLALLDDEAEAELEPLDARDTLSTRVAMAALAAARDGDLETRWVERPRAGAWRRRNSATVVARFVVT